MLFLPEEECVALEADARALDDIESLSGRSTFEFLAKLADRLRDLARRGRAKETYTTGEVAQRLNVTTAWVTALCRRAELEYEPRRFGEHYRILKSSVDRFLGS